MIARMGGRYIFIRISEAMGDEKRWIKGSIAYRRRI